MVSEDTITNYFFLDKRIQKTKRRIEREAIIFNSRNYYTCIQEVYEEVRTIAFRIDKEVTDYVTSTQQAELYLEILSFKKKHFMRFMNSLDYQDRTYFYQHYRDEWPTVNDRLNKVITEEIQEIEDAVQLRYGDQIREMTKTETTKSERKKNQLPTHIRNFLDLDADDDKNEKLQFESFLQT